MAKKAKATPNVLEQLAAYSPPWEEPEEKKEDKGGPDANLVERLGKIEAQLEAANRERLYTNFQSAPAVREPAQKQAASTEINLDNLPDPVTHTKEHSAELAKRISAVHDAKLAALQAEQAVTHDRESLVNSLWEGFKKSQPEWAEHELLVEAAAGRVSQSMQHRGVNVVALMKANPEAFFGEIAGMLDKQYPQLKKAGGAQEEAEEGEEGPAQVFGGTPGKQSGKTDSPSVEDENMAWLREVTEMQYKKGLK